MSEATAILLTITSTVFAFLSSYCCVRYQKLLNKYNHDVGALRSWIAYLEDRLVKESK